VAVGADADGGLGDFLEASKSEAHKVLDPEEGHFTYLAGVAFNGLAQRAMTANLDDEYLPEIPTAIFLIWAALTDEMDAPGRGSAEQDAAAVRHMKRAAADWLTVVDSREDRSAYLDHWQYHECGYRRSASNDAQLPD
jgi:hypothetical protein